MITSLFDFKSLVRFTQCVGPAGSNPRLVNGCLPGTCFVTDTALGSVDSRINKIILALRMLTGWRERSAKSQAQKGDNPPSPY